MAVNPDLVLDRATQEDGFVTVASFCVSPLERKGGGKEKIVRELSFSGVGTFNLDLTQSDGS